MHVRLTRLIKINYLLTYLLIAMVEWLKVPDIAKPASADGDVALPVDEVVIAGDPRTAGRRTQIAHRLRRLDVVRDVLQEPVPVARVLTTHRHLLAEEAAVSVAEDAKSLGVLRVVHVIVL